MSLQRLALTSVLAFAAVTLPAYAQSPKSPFVQTTGALMGEIRDAAGISQMGATVLLYDRYENLVRRAISTDDGRFAFAGLAPDAYTVRVTLSSFFPAIRRNIMVLAGSENLLRVSLANVLSSVDIVPGASNKATLMSDDWKWVLRASQSTRPVLRFLPIQPASSSEKDSLFADMTGVVRVSGGDSNLLNNSLQQDMGTAFALETPVNSTDRVRVAATLGYASSGLPSAGIRTTYLRKRGALQGPQISMTMRQAYFPAAINGNAQNTPMLRTASISSIDSIDILDSIRLEYGFSMDSITLYGRMNYFSPFARATYNMGNGGQLKVAYSSGFTPAELIARQPEGQTDLNQDILVLGQGPRISRRDNRAAVERNRSYEATYEVTDGKRSFYATAYRDETANAAFLMSGSTDMAGVANLLPDFNTRGTVFNAGNFQRTGVALALNQIVNDFLDFAIAGGQAGALVADQSVAASGSPLRTQIQTSPRPWVTMRVNGTLPWTGTRLSASYGWTDFRALMPTHQSLTGHTDQHLGWNVSTRQPLPSMHRVRMEVLAELRNALAQGYLRLDAADGRQAILTNTPRQVRGGLAFIF